MRGRWVAVAVGLLVWTAGAGAPARADNLTPPQIVGTPTIGSQLTVDIGTWTGTPPYTASYYWERCNASGCQDALHDGNSSVYVPDGTDMGWSVRVDVVVHDSTGFSQGSAYTAETAPVDGTGATAPYVATPAAFVGDLSVGSTITFTDPTWGGTGPIGVVSRSVEYCLADHTDCHPESLYGPGGNIEPVLENVGAAVFYHVTASNPLGSTPASFSSPGTIQSSADDYSGGFRLAGDANVDSVLTVALGSWNAEEISLLTFAYQWLRCSSASGGCVDVGTVLPGSYVVQKADLGSYIALDAKITNAYTTFDVVTPGYGPIGPQLSSGSGAPTGGTTATGGTTPAGGTTPGGLPGAGGTSTPTATPVPPTAGTTGNGGGGTTAPTLLRRTAIAGVVAPRRTIRVIEPRWSVPARLTYAWQVCSRSVCRLVAGANGPTLRVLAGWRGHLLRAIVEETVGSVRLRSASPFVAVGAGSP